MLDIEPNLFIRRREMDKLEIINELRDQLGTWRFYYYSSSPDKAPKLYEGKSAKLVVCNLLDLSVSTAAYDEIISSFTRKIFAPANIFGSSTLNKNNLEELCTSLLIDLYYYKKI